MEQTKTTFPVPPQKSREEVEFPSLAEKPYEQFVPELLASYATVGGLNNRDAHNMPSTRAVGQICEDLLQLVFSRFS
ncbi:MAG: hypothetical protein WDN00_12850 [Limisphaerales bacterium]